MSNLSVTPSARRRGKREIEKPFSCGIHQIQYLAIRAGCPMCDLSRENEILRSAVDELSASLANAQTRANALEGEVDLSRAMRESVELIVGDDLAFLKTVLYQWRDQREVMLSVSRTRKKGRLFATQFIASPKRGDPWAHKPTSLGGNALLTFYDEALGRHGQPKAMEILSRGLAPILPGGV